MLAIKIWNYLRGYVIIKVKGSSLERLLNLALANDIYLWDVSKTSPREIRALVSIEGYKRLVELMDSMGCQGEIIGRKGIPFTIEYFKKRKMLALGLVIFILAITVLSSMLWKIEINGLEQIPEKEINKLLERENVKLGVFKKGIDLDQIEYMILNKYDYISFIEVKKEGVKLIIDLKEEDVSPERIDKSYPANIVARKKGLVMKVIAKNGKAMVDKGRIVNEGDLLISGYMDSENTEKTYLVHARGEVFAKTRYSAISELAIVDHEERETGRVYRQRGIKLANKGIKLFSGDIPFKDYSEEVEEKSLLKIGNLSLGLKFLTYTYREVELKEVRQDIDFLKNAGYLKALEEINKELDDNIEIVSREVLHDIKGNILETRLVLEVMEDISKIEIINN